MLLKVEQQNEKVLYLPLRYIEEVLNSANAGIIQFNKMENSFEVLNKHSMSKKVQVYSIDYESGEKVTCEKCETAELRRKTEKNIWMTDAERK